MEERAQFTNVGFWEKKGNFACESHKTKTDCLVIEDYCLWDDLKGKGSCRHNPNIYERNEPERVAVMYYANVLEIMKRVMDRSPFC